MEKRTVVVGSITAVVTSRTNRSDMNSMRYVRALATALPDITKDPELKNSASEFIVCLSRMESVTGAAFSVPAFSFAPDDIALTYLGYLDETPELRTALLAQLDDMDKVTSDPAFGSLTEEQRKDPNSDAPGQDSSGNLSLTTKS